MADMRIMVFGDGPNELGKPELWGQWLPAGDLGALPQIVDHLLKNPKDVEYSAEKFKKNIPHTAIKIDDIPKDANISTRIKHKSARKVQNAILLAKANGCQAIIILIDRDTKPDSERIALLKEGRDTLATYVGYPVCAVGCAVETFDAWMIADGKAIGLAGGDASRSHREPEKMDGKEDTGRHPKDRAGEVFGGKTGLSPKYAAVALHVDLELLEKACPKGFKPFAEEVRDKILPTISN